MVSGQLFVSTLPISHQISLWSHAHSNNVSYNWPKIALAIFQQSGPKLSWPYVHSNNFWPNWPQFSIISHALQQFFMKLAQIDCNLPQSGENFTPTRTNFHDSFSWSWPKLIVIYITVEKTLPPLRQFLGIMAKILQWCQTQSDIFSTKRPMDPENSRTH